MKLSTLITGASFNRGRSKQDYQTPADFIRAVERHFGEINLDLAASLENAKAPSFFDEEHNSLIQSWRYLGGNLWLNPPFGNIEPWARKCAYEAARGAKILLLAPASIGSNWFADHVHGKAMVLALNPRLCFNGKNPYPKDCILACYNFGSTGFDVWKWK